MTSLPHTPTVTYLSPRDDTMVLRRTAVQAVQTPLPEPPRKRHLQRPLIPRVGLDQRMFIPELRSRLGRVPAILNVRRGLHTPAERPISHSSVF